MSQKIVTHTPEPWHVSGSGSHLHIGSMKSPMVLASMNDVHTRTEANARRIVACVNACEGVPDFVLENGGVGIVRAQHAAIVAQRDELLAALKALKKYATHKHNCQAININKAGKRCDCGYSEVIKKSRATMKKHKNPHPWKSEQSAAGREKRNLARLMKEQKPAKIDHLTDSKGESNK